MFRYHLLLSIRNLLKQGLISGINILGLGFGIAVSIIIFLFVQHESGFNRYHDNADRIYRIINRYSVREGGLEYSSFQADGIAEGLKQDLPFVEYSSVFRRTRIWAGVENRKYRIDIGFVHPDFLQMFSLSLVAGQPETAFEHPRGIVLCRSLADNIFSGMAGEYEQMIGQSLVFPQRDQNLYMVTAIIDDLPDNSSMFFTALTHFDNCHVYPRANDAFGANSVYLQLREGTDPLHAQELARTLIDKYVGNTLRQLTEYLSLKEGEYTFTWELQSLNDMYLQSADIPFSYEKRGNKQVLYFLSIIAMVILFIACFNYIMLTISHSMERMKEIAVMKIMGAHRVNIIRKFWGESFLLVILAMLLGIVMAEQLLPLFNRLSEKNLEFTLYRNWSSYVFLFMVLLGIVFTTSSYIATFLFVHNNPIAILRHETVMSRKYGFARLFIVLQYFISVSLLACTLIITYQLRHMRSMDVGYNKKDLVVLDVDFPKAKIDALKTRLLENPMVDQVTMSDRNLVSGRSSNDLKNKRGELVETRVLRVDNDYVKTMGLQIVKGENFREYLPSDTMPLILVNETLVKHFGMEEPVGDLIFFEPFKRYIQIQGVVKDFHFDSMKERIQPLILATFPYNSIWAVFVRIRPENRQAALDHIRAAWNEVVPEYPLGYTFMDDLLDTQYVNEERWVKITGISSLAAMFLTALGLLGLTGLLVSRRVKEIGIRKVNGARIQHIIGLINADFLKWVLAALILSIPVSLYIMKKWLQNFENRINLAWWYFALAGITAIVIAIVTISWRSWKYARKNPVETLRYE